MNQEYINILKKTLDYHISLKENGHAENLKEEDVEMLKKTVAEIEQTWMARGKKVREVNNE